MAPSTRTYVAKPTDRERNWLVVDANGKTLGRMATQIADALRGKRKPEYTPHIDTGDFVVVVNAEKVHVTGNKRKDKRYYRHSGYPGGLRSRTFEEMQAQAPGGDHQAGGERHAAAQPAGEKADHEAQDLRRTRASACRAEAAADGDRGMMADEEKDEAAEIPQETPRGGQRAVGRAARRARRRAGAGAEEAQEQAPGEQVEEIAAVGEDAPAGRRTRGSRGAGGACRGSRGGGRGGAGDARQTVGAGGAP